MHLLSKRKRNKIGADGERSVQMVLSQLPRDDYVVFNDIMLKDRSGHTFQIDHIVISCFGVFVIETKNYTGCIIGTDNDTDWLAYTYGGSPRIFYSPVAQNRSHMAKLAQVLNIPLNFISGIVVFVNPNVNLQGVHSDSVLCLPQLLPTISSFNNVILDINQVYCICDELALWNITSQHLRSEHNKYVSAVSRRRKWGF